MRELQWLGSLTELSSGFRLEVTLDRRGPKASMAWNEGDGQVLLEDQALEVFEVSDDSDIEALSETVLLE